ATADLRSAGTAEQCLEVLPAFWLERLNFERRAFYHGPQKSGWRMAPAHTLHASPALSQHRQRRREAAVTDTDVLIAGAGPTGLALALWLARSGVRVRIVDKVAEPGTTSRALVVHARTLEFYRQIGLADAVVERGLKFAAVNLWVKGRQVAHV